MSSEEVAELAQAIHSHADALYESWTKGPEALRRMTRMEDTLELLADPGLTPKLEHLVSTFVRRDRAKRQQGTSPVSHNNNNNHNNSVNSGGRHHPSPPPKDSESIVTNIPINVQNGSGSATSKKPLPKSILAVVQRFEPSSPSSSSPLSSPVPVNSHGVSNSVVAPQNVGGIGSAVVPTFSALPAEPPRMGKGGGGVVGNVSRNVIWAESNSRHTVTKKSLRQHVQQPQHRQSVPPLVANSSPTLSSSSSSSSSSSPDASSLLSRSRSPGGDTLSPTRKIIRERHIPIERCDDSDLPELSPTTTTTPSPPGVPSASTTRVINVTREETSQNVLVNNLGHSQVLGGKRGTDIQELEREEERLFQALRTGQVLPKALNGTSHLSSSHSNESISSSNSLDTLRERAGLAPLSSSSRIAFAKERIRQSQEHPLTQQRLELQKRLPSPSSSLAAAIAVQQGKIKFQPGDQFQQQHHEEHHFTSSVSGGSPSSPKENGRQSWVSSLRFNNGASVADRVQLFEKYPAHIVGPPSPASPLSPHHTSPHHHHHPPSLSPGGGLPSVLSGSSVPSQDIPLLSPSTGGSGNVSVVNVAMSPTVDSPNSVISAGSEPLRKPTSPSTTASWRGIPIEHYQPDISGSGGAGKKAKQLSKPVSPASSATSLSGRSSVIHPPVPRFYWPEGRRPPVEFVEDAVVKARDVLAKYPPYLNYLHIGQIISALGIPLYWKKPIWNYLGLKNEELVDSGRFLRFYTKLMSGCPDDETRFLCIMSTTAQKKTCSNNKRPSLDDEEFAFSNFTKLTISMSDFIPMMQDIIDTHPGLGFLREAPEFHSRYITTVISRIFYKVNKSWSGKITLPELRRSNLLRIIKRLEEETDVNAITECFSYEHFYVIYCKFWELDKDHDLLIDKNDLSAHADLALSPRIIDRIFEGTVIRGWDVASPVKYTPGKMTYSDFVWFLLSEEDKKTPTAIEYWFRCLDIDGDGVLSPYELEYFYEEQQSRIESFGIEPLDFANVYCQMVDMLRCSPTGIRLSDLKQNPQLAATVFNTLFNLDKYLDHEQRDPFAAAATSSSGHEIVEGESDWDKYASAEYENLIAEESPSDHLHEDSDFEDSAYSTS